MVAIYVRWILAGRMALADVPEIWREAVQMELQGGLTNDKKPLIF